MIRHAFATRAAFSRSIEGPSGRQRLQGRKPVALALSKLSWSRTFLGLGVREGHDGRQYTPVVETEYQKCLSAVLSRATMRAHRGSSATDGVVDFVVIVIVIILHSSDVLDR